MILLPLVLTAAARTPPGPEAMAAFEGNARSGYTFVSVVSPSRAKGFTLIARMTASYLYYHYDDARVVSPGVALALGLGWRPTNTAFSLLAGYEARYLETRTGGSPASARAAHGVVLTADLYRQLAAYLAVGGSASYAFSQDYLWSRIYGSHQVWPPRGTGVVVVSLGIDATFRGNPDVRGLDGGAFAAVAVPGEATSFVLRAGVGRELPPRGDPRAQGVLGLSVYRSF